jgi:hypothetical protein
VTELPDHDRFAGAALDAYRDTAHTSFRPVPSEVIVARARTRARRQVALVAAAVVLATGSVAAAVGLGLRPDGNKPTIDYPITSVTTAAPPSATGSPSASPSSAPVAAPPTQTSTTPAPGRTTVPPVDLRDVDWANATVRMPSRKDDDECPVGRVTFADGEYDGSDTTTLIRPGYQGEATYGDLNGDGRADAVVYVTCLEKEDSGDSSGQLLAVTGRSGSLVGMGYLGPVAQVPEGVRIAGNRVTLTVTEKFSQVTQERTYRWNGSRFSQTGGPTAFPKPS